MRFFYMGFPSCSFLLAKAPHLAIRFVKLSLCLTDRCLWSFAWVDLRLEDASRASWRGRGGRSRALLRQAPRRRKAVEARLRSLRSLHQLMLPQHIGRHATR